MKFVLTHMEELLPIAIFLIVMIYSAVGNKKRRPAPERDEDDSGYRYDTEDAPGPAQTPRAGSHGEPVDDELRRTLNDIFTAKKPQPSTTAHTSRHEDNEWQKTVDNRKIKEAKKAAVKAEAKAAQRAAGRAPSPVLDPIAATTRALESTEAPPAGYASAEQARVGVIWSEILQRPVALR